MTIPKTRFLLVGAASLLAAAIVVLATSSCACRRSNRVASSATRGQNASKRVGHVTATSATVPCALTHAAGADGTNSCWATHTGVQAGTGYTVAQIEASAPGFTKVNGAVTITQPGTVIDHEWINGCIAINAGANNVTIKNTLITSDGSSTCASDVGGTFRDLLNTGQDSGATNAPLNTLVQDVTVDGTNLSPGYGGGSSGITIAHGKCLRCNVFGFIKNYTSTSGTAQNPILFQDSYSHDMAYYGDSTGCAHSNGFWVDSSTYINLEHNYAIMGRCVSGAISLQSDWGPPTHITVDHNYLEGSSGRDLTGGCATNTTVTNNAFSSNNGYGGTDFADYFKESGPGNSWSGNYVAETSAPLSPPGC